MMTGPINKRPKGANRPERIMAPPSISKTWITDMIFVDASRSANIFARSLLGGGKGMK